MIYVVASWKLEVGKRVSLLVFQVVGRGYTIGSFFRRPFALKNSQPVHVNYFSCSWNVKHHQPKGALKTFYLL